jgi:hypothetical protein
MAQDSILAQPFVKMLMTAAKQNLERDGRVHPVLYLRLSNNQRLMVLVDLAPTSKRKQGQGESRVRHEGLQNLGRTCYNLPV